MKRRSFLQRGLLSLGSLCLAMSFSVTLFSVTLFSGCDSAPSVPGVSSSPKSNDGKLRIAVIPKGTSHQFWQTVHAGAEAAAKELGNVEILWKGPETEADTAGQISVVKNFITNGVHGI